MLTDIKLKKLFHYGILITGFKVPTIKDLL